MFARLRKVGRKQSDEEIWEFIDIARGIGLRDGKSVAEARASGDELLNYVLDHEMIDENFDLKPDT